MTPVTARRVAFRRLIVALVTTSAVVSALGLAVELLHHTTDLAVAHHLTPHLSLSEEANLPTWWASTLLAACAVLLGINGTLTRGGGRRGFWVLAVGFLYMSLDETATLHEQLNGLFELRGALYFSWIIPASIAVAVVALAMIPFVRQLPATTRRGFLAAGALYVGGAIVMELPLGFWIERSGADLGYFMIDWVEESLELAGATLFAIHLLRHLDQHVCAQEAA